MSATLLTPPYLQFFDANGDPLAGGTVETYAAGTVTPMDTYTDASGTISAPNPIQLNASGIPQTGNGAIWINGSYKIIVKDVNGTTIDTQDNITAFSTAAAGAGTFSTLNVTDSSTGAIGNHMQCRLVVNGANFQLQPYNGNIISISGVNYIIPQTGTLLAPSGLSATTTYYVYALISGSDIVLSAVTTGYVISGNGIPVRSDNSAQTLVGQVYLKTGASTTGALVRSWANRNNNSQVGTLTVNASTTSTTPVIPTNGITSRIEALVWLGEMWNASTSGTVTSTVTTVTQPGIFFDGASSVNVLLPLTGAQNTAYSVRDGRTPSEGYHYYDLGLATSAGTATFQQGNRLIGEIM